MKTNYHKLIYLILPAFLLCAAFIPASQQKGQAGNVISDTIKDQYLELKGNVRHMIDTEKEHTKSIPIDSALVTIYCADVPYSEFFTNKKGKCIFRLPLDKQFRVEISKPGFITKSVEVNTKLPNDKKGTYSFTFDIEIFEEVKGLDVSVLQKPIARVYYNLIHEAFQYDAAYTNRINADLKKMYKKYYALQQALADSSMQAPVVADTVKK